MSSIAIDEKEKDVFIEVLKTVGVPVQKIATMSTALYQAYDKIRDCERFLDDRNKFLQLDKFIKDLDKSVEFVSEVAKQEQQRLSNESYWQYLTGNNDFSLTETNESLNPEYIKKIKEDHKKLSEIYGDGRSMTKRADDLLQQRNWLAIGELLILFAQIAISTKQVFKSNEDLNWCTKELKKIESTYIQPVIEALRNNKPPDMTKINNGILELTMLKKYVIRAANTSSSNFWSSAVNFISSGLSAYSTFTSVSQLHNVASVAVVSTQKLIGSLQAVASVANLVLAGLHGYNWIEFNHLIDDISAKMEKMEDISKKFQQK